MAALLCFGRPTWVVVKIMVPFWVLVIIRHLMFRAPKRGPNLTTTHMPNKKPLALDSNREPEPKVQDPRRPGGFRT